MGKPNYLTVLSPGSTTASAVEHQQFQHFICIKVNGVKEQIENGTKFITQCFQLFNEIKSACSAMATYRLNY